jgi:hypothetical protein
MHLMHWSYLLIKPIHPHGMVFQTYHVEATSTSQIPKLALEFKTWVYWKHSNL